MRQVIEQTILNEVTPKAITSSTNATPSVVTVTSHGFTTGDRVLIYGHATNTAINGIFKVTVLTANTFSLQDEFTGADVAANGVGAGTGFAMSAPTVLRATDFKAIDYTVILDSTPTMTVTPFISNGKMSADSSSPRMDHPNFGATIAKTNPYESVNFVTLIDGVATAGSTGLATAGTETEKNIEINTNGVKYATIFPTSWTAGRVSIKARCYYF